ncbi:hypothetical protein [Terasakiella pusilla]|uniref:hypothetical protein n=1 Tax=Terasakiella pusilla TaxID=64973 RepID=UPI000491DC3B|nr:hypothetical protein [Terasakiella pusilla]
MRVALFMSVIVLLLTGCVTAPSYKKAGATTEPMQAGDVNYKLSGLYHRDPPDCVSVFESDAPDQPVMGKALSVALARHLGEKVDRVIFPRVRARIAQQQGYDLNDATDRARYASHTRCRFYARAVLYDLGDDYVGVFAKKQVGVMVQMMRIQDEEPVWQAAHTVWRADGGVPTSPLALVGGVAQAAMFSADEEIIPSLIDDAMRRMMRTLPLAS